MPVEFIGMIATKDQSETRPGQGPVIDKDFTRRFVRPFSYHGQYYQGISVSFRPILGPTEELAWERAHRILEATKENIAAYRAQWGAKSFGLGGDNPENVGSQRLLAAVAKGELHDRALWTPLAGATGAGGNSTALVGTPETVAQAMLDYIDIGVTTILIRGYDPYDDAIDYGRSLLPLVREEVARRDAEKAVAQQPATGQSPAQRSNAGAAKAVSA